MSVFDFGREGQLHIDQKRQVLCIRTGDDFYDGELSREEALQLAHLILHLLGGETFKPAPQSFGRFTYFGRLGSYAHVWSTCDPPLYGTRLIFDEAGKVQIAVSGDDGQVMPSKAEQAAAEKMLQPPDLGPERYSTRPVKRAGWLKRKASEIVSRHIYRVVLRRMEKGKTG